MNIQDGPAPAFGAENVGKSTVPVYSALTLALALDQVITVINTPPILWLRQPPLPPGELTEHNRKIVGGPLLDLLAIQACMKSGEVDPNEMWVATQNAEDDLYQLQWDESNVGKVMSVLRREDYRNSEFCKSSSNSTHPCDVYLINYDDEDESRDWRAPSYYLKFSLIANRLTIVLISCHLERNA